MRPAHRLPQRAQADRHPAQPRGRDPAGGRPALAKTRNWVQHGAGRPRLRQKKRQPSSGATPNRRPRAWCSAPTKGGPSRPRATRGPQRCAPPPARGEPLAAPGKKLRTAGALKAAFSASLNPGTVGLLRCPTRGAPRLAWVDFLHAVDSWVGPEPEAVFVIVDNLWGASRRRRAFFSSVNPRWQFVFQPTYAAYLNLITPWWKLLPWLAPKGRRFEIWSELAQAVERATAYWNAHRHPFRWGRRRRHRPRRQPGCARVPLPA